MLATPAFMHVGDIEDPNTGKPTEQNLPAARHMIELLELVQEKTQGNLSDDESRLLEDLLYELRMRFVQVQQQGGGPRIIVP